MSAKPSLDCNLTGFSLCFANAVFAATFLSPSQTSPSPISGNAKCAKGAKSPDAPNEPWV